ncbi:glycosyltransferase family 2 protein [Tardiphaga sp. vice278]|uniref:glycosyltransferase family 2 protein n=1 Tax=Tardiphaga sp. vice278 TaxID=2592815 RepID=UPI001AEDBB44|nr:glycosyltransferase [Tardiphaga sp. vice278]
MKDPLVSVYVTNFNYGRYIRTALESVYQQSFKDFELIIIDDGSTDDSREIIAGYSGRPQTRIILQDNKGLNATNNIAVRAARGKYIMRLDADDFLNENALLVMTTMLENDPELALVFPDYFYVDDSGEVTGQERRHNFQRDVTLLDQPAHGACTMIRRDVLIEVNAYSEGYRAQDGYDLWLKIIERYKVGNVDLPLFSYRRHTDNLTNNQELILRTRSEILKAHAKRADRPHLGTICVIPVRGRAIDTQCMSYEMLDGKRLINWTIDAALGADNLDEVIVSSPDENLLKMIVADYGDRVGVHLRPREQGLENVSYDDGVFGALAGRRSSGPVDAIMLLTIDAPFRSSFYIDKAISVMQVFSVDVVLGVLPDNDLFLQHNGAGLTAIGTNAMKGPLRFERDYIYRHSGGAVLVRKSFYEKNFGRPLEGRIGHFVLSRQAATSVRTPLELKIAEAILNYEAGR